MIFLEAQPSQLHQLHVFISMCLDKRIREAQIYAGVENFNFQCPFTALKITVMFMCNGSEALPDKCMMYNQLKMFVIYLI